MLGRARLLAECIFLLAMAALALIAISRFVWFIWPEGWRGEGAAAWFQAVGAIAGIGIAVYVPWRQRLDTAIEERQRWFQERADSLMLLMVLADEVERYLDTLGANARPSHGSVVGVNFRLATAGALLTRLEAFQDRARLEVCASLAYELRKTLMALLARVETAKQFSSL